MARLREFRDRRGGRLHITAADRFERRLELLALGAGYLVRGPGFFFEQVPDSTLGAIVCVLLGLGIICVAAVRMLTEAFKQMPDAGEPR